MRCQSQEIRAFCLTYQFWTKIACQNVLVTVFYLNMI